MKRPICTGKIEPERMNAMKQPKSQDSIKDHGHNADRCMIHAPQLSQPLKVPEEEELKELRRDCLAVHGGHGGHGLSSATRNQVFRIGWMAATVLHDMVLNCDIQGLKATIKDLQKEGIDVKDEVTSHEFGRRGARPTRTQATMPAPRASTSRQISATLGLREPSRTICSGLAAIQVFAMALAAGGDPKWPKRVPAMGTEGVAGTGYT
eukprot:Skav228908  [mRNA]  locus=scaffold118:104527:107132:+ [translate_table: standard]